MKKLIVSTIMLLSAVMILSAQPQPVYEQYFTNERLRLDITFAGDLNTQSVFLENLHKEEFWSGSKKNLVDPFDYGDYYYKVFNSNNELIFSKGFNTLFREWRTTAEAKTTKRSFASSYWIPFPKEAVKVVFYERLKETGKLVELESFNIDPNDKLISMEVENDFKINKIIYNGVPSDKVDLLFIAEGYTQEQMDKFRADAERFAGYLFDIEPYKSRKEDFNIWAVESVSKDSGTDIPHQNIWKNTVLSSNFYTFYIDRYLTVSDQRGVASVASNAHCDAMYVIVNTEKYGGGGIYNFYGLSMADNRVAAEVFVHEFGHSFAGLADEYYTSEVAYEEFYNFNVEPWEPNITTLVDFSKKWEAMITTGAPIPTPNDESYKGVVGLFEGGGYMAKGIYRPVFNCRMKANNAESFCPVCTAAINRMIDYYAK